VRQVLDSNGSGGLTSQEFCAAMKKLVRPLDAGWIVETPAADSFQEIKQFFGVFSWHGNHAQSVP
jgi:hypothetical protein